MQTTMHCYRLDLTNRADADNYKALRKKLRDDGLTCHKSHDFGKSSHYHSERNGLVLTLETAHLFSNQWNTAPIPGISKDGLRVFDWAEDYPIGFDRHVRRGYWLEQTREMRAVRDNTAKCGYCGKQEPKGAFVFCPHCLGSEYLKEDDLSLTRMIPVSQSDANPAPLTGAEMAERLPLYIEAQTKGTNERDVARIKKECKRVIDKADNAIRSANDERDGMLWLLDRAFRTDNVIYYAHTGRFCFGWRRSLDTTPALKSRLLDMLSEFPFDYDIK